MTENWNDYNWNPKKKRGGFEPLPSGCGKQCRHPSHEPPNMLYIPPGQCYRHICPGCGREMVLHNALHMW